MSWLRKLFGSEDAPQQTTITALQILGDESYQFEVVGEASYQGALFSIVGQKSPTSARLKRMALLVCEKDNEFDGNAVSVWIEDKKVAYFSRDDAKRFRAELRKLRPNMPVVQVRAMIVGGWKDASGEGHFGVKLDLSWPLAG